jgi:phosphatidate cytidylyltransferase
VLLTRILSALVMGLVLAVALFGVGEGGWALAMLMLTGIGAWEWAALAGFKNRARLAATLLVVVCCVLAGLWCGVPESIVSGLRPELAEAGRGQRSRVLCLLGVGALFWCVIVPGWLWRLPQQVSSVALFAMAFPALVPAWLATVVLRSHGAGCLLGAMAIVWIADTSGYGFGRWLGRHKLAPRVSPGKTWEGVMGGLAMLLVYGVWLVLGPASAALKPAGLAGALAGILFLGAVSVEGDLFESSLKRRAGVKDSGSLIPGHGGVLDRLDAQFSTLPLAALLLHLSGVL